MREMKERDGERGEGEGEGRKRKRKEEEKPITEDGMRRKVRTERKDTCPSGTLHTLS